MRIVYQFLLIISAALPLAASTIPTSYKPVLSRPSTEAHVVLESQSILEACDTEQICVEGMLFNDGAKPAAQVKLRIEIGGTKQGRPRHVIVKKADSGLMQPGDRQEFYLTIDRKITVKDQKGEEKTIEVGKFNFKIVPVWSAFKPKPAPKKKSRPK